MSTYTQQEIDQLNEQLSSWLVTNGNNPETAEENQRLMENDTRMQMSGQEFDVE